MSAIEQPAIRRSRFVSIVAWIGILSGAGGTLGAVAVAVAQPGVRAIIVFLSSAAVLSTSLGLRARREWARQGFILVLAYAAALGIVWALTVHVPRLSDIPNYHSPNLSESAQARLDAAWKSERESRVVMAVLGAAVNGLLILAFASKRIRREFSGESAA